ncbi:MAG TPA: trypsin-like peptidase domain-containing protein [Vicinamibacterales bacterium]|nr:trypsin-like peptidase domain-containing protein [Vicinamibacterales bacterium]
MPPPGLGEPAPASHGTAGAIARTTAAVVVVLAGSAWWLTRARPAPQPAAPTVMAARSATVPAGGPAQSTILPAPSPVPPFERTTPPQPQAGREAAAPSTLIVPSPTTLEDLVSRVSPAVVTIEAASARGSGFFVAPDTVLTNVHVVTSNASVTVRRADGSTTTARVEAQSAPYDIAVLKISNPLADQPIIPMGSAAGARVGQEVIAIGTPLGFLQNTVSRGIVSALREVDGATMIQTDAAINPGNSGGPLLDRTGMVIGIVKSGYSGREGLSFAVAIDHARAVLDGRPAPAPSVTSAPSQYRALSPAVTAPTDERRNDAAKAFEQAIAQLARRADALDDQWRNFRNTCYEGRVAGSFDHEWFALWDQRAMQGAVSRGCGPFFGEIRQTANAIRDAVLAAEETARRADVYPGTRREVLHHWRLDYTGWGR